MRSKKSLGSPPAARQVASLHLVYVSRSLLTLFIYVVIATIVHPVSATGDASDAVFQYTRGPVPDHFRVGMHYPSRNETDVCRPIRLRIERDSRLFRTNLVINANPGINFANSDAKRMTSRLQSRLNTLASMFYSRYQLRFTVFQAWVEYSDDDGVSDPQSLHYEGRTVRLSVRSDYVTELLQAAIEAGFDWVVRISNTQVRLSVIPDVCDANIDMVFMLDQSGSVGQYNHDTALYFLQDVVSFYNISPNATQVGLVTFSSGATIRFDLDEHSSLSSLTHALRQVRYTGGWTTTAFALYLTRLMLNPNEAYGARPFSQGIPKVAVLITDGRSNLYPIDGIAPLLRSVGVQVYTVGIGEIYLPELLFIASDPDPLHVFLLDSYNDAPAFVDFLSFTTCDTPAIVEPGDNTTTEVDEDGFRFFQSACPAFSVTIMIEQIDLVGSCSLYASNQIQNPGPLSPQHLIVSNENRHSNRRSVHLSLPSYNKYVYVSVRGHGLRNHFSVIIWDMIFGEDLYNISVPEGVADVNVFDVSQVLRMTNVTFNYTIKDGNEDGFFSLNSITGVLSVTSPLNADLHDYFLLTIVAQNSAYSCHRGRVKIKIIVARDGIDFPDLQPVLVPETADPGTPLTQVQVIGDDGNILYTIIGGNVGGAFEINPSTGVVSVASELDFETLSLYELTIRGSSTVSGSSATAMLLISVEDVNERPFFTDSCAQSGNCNFSVTENGAAGVLVGVLNAEDPDIANVSNSLLTFSVESVGGSVPFVLVSEDGQVEIRTAEVLDRETQSTYDFVVRVSDGGSPSLSAEVPVSVDVIDVNDNAPVFVQTHVLLTVSEATMLGTVIAEYTAIDADDGDFGSIVYTVSSAIPDLPFAINPESGELAVNATLDFETNTLYVVEVIASNPDGQQSTSTTTFVSIVDENDNPPIFSQDVYSDNVTEHSAGGTAILTVTASDADSADNGEIVFSIVSGNLLNFFAIDTISGGLGVIRVAEGADINREIISFFNLTIRANDLGSPQMEDFAQVIIMVNDINDNAPVFLPGLYLASVREDVDPPSEVLRTFAIDLDQPGTPNSQIDYAITGGNVGNVFALNRIDNSFAALVLVGSLDFETQPTYRLVITAMDRGTPQLNGTADVVILVTDVNTEPPTVEGNQTVPLSELTPVGTEIARINATDFDSPQIMFIINSVTGDGVNGNDGLGFFSINDQGVITLDQPLDFEQNLSYEIEIIVTDGLLSSTTTVLVTVIDANEFDPVFNDLQPLQVQEELPAGTVVGTVQATDDDRNSTVTYSIIMEGPSSALFTIDSQMGIIRTNQTLDREDLVAWDLFLPSEESSVVIRVQAVDSGTPSRFSIAEVTIMLIDINDNAPVFDMITDGFQASVFEERPAGTLVVNAFARDLDLGSNGDVNYTLEVVGFADVSLSPFEIDPETGLISTTRPLDRESVDSYTFFVRAFDGGLPSLSVNATVDVAVLDVNDNAPIFLQPSYNLFVLENAFVPQQLLQVQAEDADLGSNAQITYSIRESIPINSVNLFSIDPNNGTITLVSSLDFEAASSHRLVVAADDSVNSNTTEVIVAVGNVDETPPEFFGECVVSIPENVPAGIPITQCTARDFDDSANVFRAAEGYAILSGNTNGTFSIANDGTVTLERSVDREAIPFFTIVVQAFDRVGLTNTTLLRVTITDINDNQPVLTNIPETRLVTQSEIQSQETNFFTVEASDADSGLNADLVYSLTSNIINDTTTELTITVADQGSPAMSATAILTYRFEVPCTLQVHSINESSGQVTSQLLCTISIQPLSNDLTFGTDLQLMCNVLRNVEATFEFLHNGSLVTSAIPLNPSDAAGLFNINNATFQDAGEYACKVTVAEVGSLQSDNAVVRIQVPPVVTIPPVDAAIELGRAIMFNCFATGVPQPTYTWSRRTAEGLEIVMSGPRVIVSLNFLVISPVVAEDQGVYICTASNRAGVDEASATLSIISQSNVIAMSLRSFSNPNQDQSCNIFSSSSFENAMTTITGVTTLTTEVNGTDLCEESACTPSPCMNGGECSLETEAPDGYVCTCSIGYTGVNCESDINECDDGPCQFGGSCTNTDGSFTCECRSGFTGHRCQYTSVCMETQNACPENQTCVETISNSQGFVCQDMSMTTDAVVVTGITLGPGNLDDQVNSIQEMSEQQAVRRRRQVGGVLDNNGFVTSCEARFMPVESDRFVLVWACPEGVEPPSQDELDSICRTLYDMGLVGTCSSPSGLQFNSAANDGTLPDSSIEVFFVLVDDNGRPLTGAEAMALLKRSDVLARLREYGYLATGFSAVVPPSESKLALPPSVIAGLAVALLLAVLLSVTIFVIVCLVKRRHSKKKAPPKGNHSVYQLTPKSSLRRKADQSRISQENLLEDAGPSITIKNSSANDSCDTPLNISTVSVKDIFDDGIYGEGYVPPMVVTSPERSRTTSPHQRPPSTEEVIILPGGKVVLTGKVSKRSSLERFAGGLVKVPSLKRRTESQDNLLDDDDDSHDYDDVIVNKMVESHVSHVPPPQPRPSSSNSRQHTTTASDQSNVKYRDEEIYGNLLYTKAGAMGNAGERWESYWKTRTLLRTQNGKKEKE